MIFRFSVVVRLTANVRAHVTADISVYVSVSAGISANFGTDVYIEDCLSVGV